MDHQALIAEYLQGPQRLREALAGMTPADIDAAPIPGQWSTRQVICHVADFEPVYADRMKRVIAEDEPTMFGGNPDQFAARLVYDQRVIEQELQLVEAVRRHVATILLAIDPTDFQRTGFHSVDGPITLEVLLQRITGHIPHHLRFIAEKRDRLAAVARR